MYKFFTFLYLLNSLTYSSKPSYNLMRFNISSWTWLISENAPPDTVLKNARTGEPVKVQVTTITPDFKLPEVHFSVATNNHIKINPITGEVSIKSPFDYENQKIHTFHIHASAGEYNLTARAKVFVVDENDCAPEFTKPIYHFESEFKPGQPVGVVTATDKDTGLGGKVTYSIIKSKSDYNFFTIDSYNGTIILNHDFVSDTKSDYFLTIKAEDSMPKILSGNGHLYTTAAVNIKAIKTDTHPPVWIDTSKTKIKVNENTQIGSRIGQIFFASSIDSSSFENIKVEIPKHNPRIIPWPSVYNPEKYPKVKVTIDENTGEIYLQQKLDYENLSDRKTIFTVVAFNKNNPEMKISRNMLIELVDTNDNSPYFEPANDLTVNLDYDNNEEIDLGLSVKDADSWPFNTIILELSGEAGDFALVNTEFKASSKKSVKLKRIRPLSKPEYMLVLTAKNKELRLRKRQEQVYTPSIISSLRVTVKVDGIQNSELSCNNPQPVTVDFKNWNEDLDLNLFNYGDKKPFFELLNYGNLFNVNRETGRLFKPDISDDVILTHFEEDFDPSNIVLQISADNGKKLICEQPIFIQIPESEKIHSDKPRFIFKKGNRSYDRKVYENELMAPLQLSILDDDEDFSYSGDGEPPVSILGPNANYFKTVYNPPTDSIVIVQTRPFDYEEIQAISLNLKACDKLAHCSTARFDIKILPMNEHTPIFKRQKTNLVLNKSDYFKNDKIFSATATDEDLHDKLVYKLSTSRIDFDSDALKPLDNFFKISNNGEIYLLQGLDNLDTDRVLFDVQVFDSNNQTNRLEVFADIETDDNDLTIESTPPEIAETHKFIVPEADYTNNPLTIGKINVDDPDGDIEFVFKNETDLPKGIYIHPNSGEVIANGDLNFEDIQIHSFTVSVSDFLHTTKTKVTLVITDVNECKPRFSAASRSIKIQENLQPPIIIAGDLEAYDCDEHQILDYHIATNPSHLSEHLALDFENFTLIANKAFDREKIYNFTVSITAVDSKNEIGTTTLAVYITDVNDNPPEFINLPESLTIPENTNVGATIFDIEARDSDDTDLLSYKLCTSDWVRFFEVDSESASVKVKDELSELTSLKNGQSYLDIPLLLSICVTDRNGHEATSTLTVKIADVNNHAPKFTRRIYHAYIQSR